MVATNAILNHARNHGADSPVDYGDAEQLAKAVIAALESFGILATQSQPDPQSRGQAFDGEEEALTVPHINPIYAELHPLLKPIIDKRARAAGNFAPEFSGQRGQDFDRGLLCAFEAVSGELQKMTNAALSSAKRGEEG